MYQVEDEPIETIHLYVVREGEKRPHTALPLFCVFLYLLGIIAMTIYSDQHPYYEHKRITVPAIFLPLKVFTAEAPIIPTGIKTYPATYAHGFLTITNGSVIAQTIPAGFNFTINREVEVVTDNSVYVPSGSADGYGYATTAAHLSIAGVNLPTLSINEVIGSSLFIRNLSPFTGGNPAYSITFQLPKDRQTATNLARTFVVSQKAQIQAFLAGPCNETTFVLKTLIRLSFGCQYATFKVPAYMRVSAARLSGKNFVVDVSFIPPFKPMPVK